MKKDGRRHSLTVKNTTLEDRAEYTIKLKDEKESSAPLFVQGGGPNITCALHHLKYLS